jgi:hypothetical protein
MPAEKLPAARLCGQGQTLLGRTCQNDLQIMSNKKYLMNSNPPPAMRLKGFWQQAHFFGVH